MQLPKSITRTNICISESLREEPLNFGKVVGDIPMYYSRPSNKDEFRKCNLAWTLASWGATTSSDQNIINQIEMMSKIESSKELMQLDIWNWTCEVLKEKEMMMAGSPPAFIQET